MEKVRNYKKTREKNILKKVQKAIKYFQNPPIYITTEANKKFAKQLISEELEKDKYLTVMRDKTNNNRP